MLSSPEFSFSGYLTSSIWNSYIYCGLEPIYSKTGQLFFKQKSVWTHHCAVNGAVEKTSVSLDVNNASNDVRAPFVHLKCGYWHYPKPLIIKKAMPWRVGTFSQVCAQCCHSVSYHICTTRALIIHRFCRVILYFDFGGSLSQFWRSNTKYKPFSRRNQAFQRALMFIWRNTSKFIVFVW